MLEEGEGEEESVPFRGLGRGDGAIVVDEILVLLSGEVGVEGGSGGGGEV